MKTQDFAAADFEASTAYMNDEAVDGLQEGLCDPAIAEPLQATPTPVPKPKPRAEYPPCRHCGHKGFCTRRETLRLRVAGYTFRAVQTVLHCVSCGKTQWSPEQASRFRLQIAAWLAKKGIQSGHAFKFMRKALGLKAVELSRLLSLAPETVSRWERGHRQCDPKAMTIVGTMIMDRLAGHDETIDRLRAMHNPPPESAAIDLTEWMRANTPAETHPVLI